MRFTRRIPISISFYTEYTEDIRSRGQAARLSFNRAGQDSRHLAARTDGALGYEQSGGRLQACAFVEVQWKDSFYMDNANCRRRPVRLVNPTSTTDGPQSDYLNR